MHHPDICDILLTIQDFLMLSDDGSPYEIIPHQGFYLDEYNDQEYIKQICIRRKLSSGWLEVSIHGSDEDSNLVDFQYVTSLEPRNSIKNIEIKWEHYSIDRVKDAIREILIMDKKPKSSSLDSIRNQELAMRP